MFNWVQKGLSNENIAVLGFCEKVINISAFTQTQNAPACSFMLTISKNFIRSTNHNYFLLGDFLLQAKH